MTAPNLILTNSVVGNTVLWAANTTLSSILSNASGSNQSIKLNTVMYSNGGANNIPIYCDVYRNGVGYPIANYVTLPQYSTLVVQAKDTAIYLIEGDTLRANVTNGNNGPVTVIVSYEVIS
jgi:hypothetical protein